MLSRFFVAAVPRFSGRCNSSLEPQYLVRRGTARASNFANNNSLWHHDSPTQLSKVSMNNLKLEKNRQDMEKRIEKELKSPKFKEQKPVDKEMVDRTSEKEERNMQHSSY